MISTAMERTMSLSSRRSWLVLIVCIICIQLLSLSSSSDTESLVFVLCTQSRYLPGTSYQNTVTSLLSSIVNSATVATFNNFTQLPVAAGPTASDDTTLYGLFQCRGDLSRAACSGCISGAATQLDALCAGSCGGMLQFDGCFIKYDNTMFVGVEDKAVVFKRCGPQLGLADSDALARRDAALSYMENWTETSSSDRGAYRVRSSGEIKAVAQCVEDLTVTDCQDCLMEAIERLKHDCGVAAWGDLFLGSCYARYLNGGNQLSTGRGNNNNENEFDKTLAILIGLGAVVTFVVVVISYLTKLCNDRAKGAK